ncbi:MAG: hypothetical protein ACJ8AH_11885 [Stellaceae bacterium]
MQRLKMGEAKLRHRRQAKSRLLEIMDDPNKWLMLPDVIRETVSYLRDGEDVSPHVLLGPVVRDPRDDGKWYFVVGTGDRFGVHLDCLGAVEEALADELRGSLQMAMLAHPPLVVHDFDDELEMARWAERIWPGSKTRKIRSDIESERAALARPLV